MAGAYYIKYKVLWFKDFNSNWLNMDQPHLCSSIKIALEVVMWGWMVWGLKVEDGEYPWIELFA